MVHSAQLLCETRVSDSLSQSQCQLPRLPLRRNDPATTVGYMEYHVCLQKCILLHGAGFSVGRDFVVGAVRMASQASPEFYTPPPQSGELLVPSG